MQEKTGLETKLLHENKSLFLDRQNWSKVTKWDCLALSLYYLKILISSFSFLVKMYKLILQNVRISLKIEQ